MTAGRLYCIQSWNNASETSGEQIGNRLAQSRGLHFDRLGNANTALYAEEEVVKKTTKVPLKQRILPQSVRVEKLTAEIIELEQAYKAGEFDQGEYSMLRAVAFKRRDRAVELYKKAIKVEEKDEELSSPSDEHTHSYETVYTGANSEEIAVFKPQMPSSFAVYVSLCILGCMGLMILSN